MHHPLQFGFTSLTAVCSATVLTLAACGGGGSDAPVSGAGAPAGPVATSLGGTVAVGAPITSGKLRILDATGATVASDVTVDAEGRYSGVVLSGPAPYRIEACGYAGPNYQCIYSVASGAGTANVTPLTTATVLLASGQSPGAMMEGAAPTLTDANVGTAQTQLRTSLASVLSSAGITGAFDFVSGALTAGTRSGYDGLLDAVGITFGKDAQPFVQVTPRIGTGNVYMEQGSTTGAVTGAVGAGSLQLSGLETLFRDMTSAVASAASCSSESTGLRRLIAANAMISLGDSGEPTRGQAAVAAGLCEFFAGGEDGNTPMFGASLLSPTLGRCDLTGPAPVCGVSFVLKTPEGDVQPVGNGMGVTQESGVWKFMGDLSPISLQASAKAQRTMRIDTSTPNFNYSRALAFEVPALAGLACARVSQHDASGSSVPIGFYKPHAGATDQRRLSLWTANGFGQDVSLNPLVGFTRSPDDTWIALPEGTAGDSVVRNFYRGGRTVSVSLYADSACSTPFNVSGKSEFEVEVEGVPPVWSAMTELPWPDIDASTKTALRSLTLGGGSTATLEASWTNPRGPFGVNGSTVCGSRARCGQGDVGRLGERDTRPSQRSVSIALSNRGNNVAADDEKTLALFGRTGEGVDLQSNYSSCPGSGSDESCH